MRNIEAYGTFNEGIGKSLKKKIDDFKSAFRKPRIVGSEEDQFDTETPEAGPMDPHHVFRDRRHFNEVVDSANLTDPSTVVSIWKGILAVRQGRMVGDKYVGWNPIDVFKMTPTGQDYKYRLGYQSNTVNLLEGVIDKGSGRSLSALLDEMSKIPWDVDDMASVVRYSAVFFAGNRQRLGPDETLDMVAMRFLVARIRHIFVFGNEIRRGGTLDFLLRHAIEKGLMVSKRWMDDLLRHLKQTKVATDNDANQSMAMAKVALYCNHCGLDVPIDFMSGVTREVLAESVKDLFGNPSSAIKMLKDYMRRHKQTPTVLMSAVRQAFPSEYDAEFGKEDIAADMGDMGF